MNNLIIKKRIGLPETNSSSSHSIVINDLKENKKYLKTLDDYIVDDVLIIPDCKYDFGNTSFSASNDLMKKIMFVIALYTSTSGYDSSSIVRVAKFLNYLKNVIKSFIGVRDVIFNSLSSFSELVSSMDKSDYDALEECIYDYKMTAFGYVDHQSCDLSIELFENIKILKDFIFSEDSWLFLGSDCYDMDGKIEDFLSDYYKLDKLVDKDYATINFGRNLNNVDFPLDGYGKFEDQLDRSRDNLLGKISYNPIDNIYLLDYNYSYERDKSQLYFEFFVVTSSEERTELISPIISFSDKKGFYLYLSNKNFRDKVAELSINSKNPNLPELIEEVKKETVEEKDWLEFRININTKDYGTL